MRLRIAALVLTMSAVAAAQSSNGYLFFAPGGLTTHGHTDSIFHAGGGADVHVVKGIFVNAELGVVYPKDHFDDLLGVFAIGGAYYFRQGKELRLEPFVNGGYTMMFRSGHENLAYFGGGINYWMVNHVGLRLEFRDELYTRGSTAHFWGARMGVAFR